MYFNDCVFFVFQPCNYSLPAIESESTKGRLFIVHDPEMDNSNPIESKYLKLDWSIKRASIRDLKPNISEKKQIQSIINSPNRHMSSTDKTILLKFRYSLIENKRVSFFLNLQFT